MNDNNADTDETMAPGYRDASDEERKEMLAEAVEEANDLLTDSKTHRNTAFMLVQSIPHENGDGEFTNVATNVNTQTRSQLILSAIEGLIREDPEVGARLVAKVLAKTMGGLDEVL